SARSSNWSRRSASPVHAATACAGRERSGVARRYRRSSENPCCKCFGSNKYALSGLAKSMGCRSEEKDLLCLPERGPVVPCAASTGARAVTLHQKPNTLQTDSFWMPFTANRQFKKAPRLIGRERGYHGVGFGGMSVGGMVANRRAFATHLPGVDHIRHTHDLARNAFAKDQPEHGAELADDLERMVALHGADTIAAVIV